MLTTLGFIGDRIYYATVRSKTLLMRQVENNLVVMKSLKSGYQNNISSMVVVVLSTLPSDL
jgi:hypothetical protein